MTDSDWGAGWTRSVVAYLDGALDADRDDRGMPILDDDLLLIVNGWWEPLTFTLPAIGSPREWLREVDTSSGNGTTGSGSTGSPSLSEGDKLTVQPRSLVLLKSKRPGPHGHGRKPAAS